MAIQEENELTKYTQYAAFMPDFFINFLKEEFAKRDVAGLTDQKRFEAIPITEEHPLVTAVARMIETNGGEGFLGELPSISVIEDNEAEENTRLGEGFDGRIELNYQYIQDIKEQHPKMKTRKLDGILTDKQISMIEDAILKNSTTVNGENQKDGAVVADVHGYWMRTRIFISLWAETSSERNRISPLLRSVMGEMRLHMGKSGLLDIQPIETDKGLNNFNFPGRKLYGQESRISFLNWFQTITVYDQKPLDDPDVKVLIEYRTPSDMDFVYQQASENLDAILAAEAEAAAQEAGE